MAELSIDGFIDLKPIGRGGFSTVYQARQPGAGRDVAVKVLHSILDDVGSARFDRECQILGGLSHHPGICTLYFYGVTDDQHPYFVLELCTKSMTEQIRADGPMPWPEAVEVLRHLGEALQFAHDGGVLHRDIKPENVLVTKFGQPVLTDFGIARVDDGWHTTTGLVTASIAHAAPEVLDGDAATVASDVWSLASTGYQLLTGHSPFRRATDEAAATVLTRVFRDDPPDLRPMGIPENVCAALESAMAKDPVERTPTMSAFVNLLQEIGRSRLVPPPGPSDAIEFVVPPDDAPTVFRGSVRQAPELAESTDEARSRTSNDSSSSDVEPKAVLSPSDSVAWTRMRGDHEVVEAGPEQPSADAGGDEHAAMLESTLAKVPQRTPPTSRRRQVTVIMAGAAAVAGVVAIAATQGSPAETQERTSSNDGREVLGASTTTTTARPATSGSAAITDSQAMTAFLTSGHGFVDAVYLAGAWDLVPCCDAAKVKAGRFIAAGDSAFVDESISGITSSFGYLETSAYDAFGSSQYRATDAIDQVAAAFSVTGDDRWAFGKTLIGLYVLAGDQAGLDALLG